MREVFTNATRIQCIIDDEGISFYSGQQEIFFPYGSMDTLRLNLLGVLHVACGEQICSFAVDKADRSAMKEVLQQARQANADAPAGKAQYIPLRQEVQVPVDVPAKEQLRRSKALFIQGAISKAEYDSKRRLLRGE